MRQDGSERQAIDDSQGSARGPTVPPPRLLLVEDNPADADLVRELAEPELCVLHAPDLEAAIAELRRGAVEVVVLDLGLPDSTGPAAVQRVHEEVPEVPVVVLTGSDSEALALRCLEAGAQDYLVKHELDQRNLRRAIGYAITRKREVQLRELAASLARYRALSSESQRTTVTAALSRSGAIAHHSPAAFEDLVRAYYALLDPYFQRVAERVTAPRAALERIATALGDAGGGPRDLLDVHVAALDRALAAGDSRHTRALVYEARLLALEMMGLLVDYYRVGHRRRFPEGDTA